MCVSLSDIVAIYLAVSRLPVCCSRCWIDGDVYYHERKTFQWNTHDTSTNSKQRKYLRQLATGFGINLFVGSPSSINRSPFAPEKSHSVSITWGFPVQLRWSLAADFFVPYEGRPAAVNLNYVEKFAYCEDGRTLRLSTSWKAPICSSPEHPSPPRRHRYYAVQGRVGEEGWRDVAGAGSARSEDVRERTMSSRHTCRWKKQTSRLVLQFYADYAKEVQGRIDLTTQAAQIALGKFPIPHDH